MNITSLEPALLGDWIIKLSSVEENILLIMFNYQNKDTVVNYFTDEHEVNMFINMWIEKHLGS